MPIAHISDATKSGLYFITPTVSNWYYVFDRYDRWQILADSLKFLQANRGLEIHGFVFMLNHLHLIVQAPDVTACIRDFKRHTALQIRNSLEQYEPRVADLFRDDSGQFHLWKTDNQPKLIENSKFYLQKLNYIYNNPVRKGYVDQPQHWKWSSANPNCPIKTTGQL